MRARYRRRLRRAQRRERDGQLLRQGPIDRIGQPLYRGNLNFHIYAAGNYHDANKNKVLDGVPVTREELGNVVVEPNPFPFPAITAVPAVDAYRTVLAHAGASLRRDSIDRRVIASVADETGAIITDPASVGGFGNLTGGTAPADTDRDGVPDAWERANGLNPDNAGDGNVIGPDGYSTVERYLNSLVP